ncbi:MAG TPA: EVE domain-containing protein [Sphingomonadaceae bacterium]|nr:EVE domain-containing protein [Sphingomonadaceae bacterium]
MAKRFWLIKSEPAAYSWEDLVSDGETVWDGVRNHRASGNLREMKAGEKALFYHSVTGKEVVGIAEVSKAGLTDPKDPEGKWAAVRFKPVRKFARPVSLAEIKADKALEGIELVRLSRLSVAELTRAEFDHIVKLGKG